MSNLEIRPVVAVIPHYNMPQSLVPLIEQTMAQKYDAIYVLDDHSINCDIRDVVAPFGSRVNLIAGSENRGAGGNRNRILEANPKLLGGAILHFIDADCELMSDNIPDEARRILADDQIGAVGGLILNGDGSMYQYNYNPRISLHWNFAVNAQNTIASLGRRNPHRGRKLRRAFEGTLTGFPDTNAEPVPRDVFCVTEANMLIPYDVFKAVNGFDTRLRYNEAQDLAYKLAANRLKERWEPSVVVKHHAVQVRGKKRILENWKSIYTVARKHGMPLR